MKLQLIWFYHIQKKIKNKFYFSVKDYQHFFLKLLFNPMKKFVKSGSDQHLI